MRTLNILKITMIVVFLLFLPTIVFADTPVPVEDSNAAEFYSGRGFIEEWFWDAFKTMDASISKYTGHVEVWAKTIGAMGCMIYMAMLAMRMQGGEPWSVQPFIKPFIFTIIILNWVQFTDFINAPLNAMSFPGESKFQAMKESLELKQRLLYFKQNELFDKVVKLKTEAELAKDGSQEDKNFLQQALDWLGDKADKLLAPVYEMRFRIEFLYQKLASDVLEFIGLFILRCCVYLIFLIQKLWMYVLQLVGPLALAFSFIPGFENSFNNWLAKYINISLWGFVGTVMVLLGMAITEGGIQMQIDRIDALLDDSTTQNLDNNILAFVSSSGYIKISIFTMVAMTVAGIGMLFVPTIADSIVSAGGAGIMNKTTGTVGKIGKGVSKGVGMAVKAGATGGVSLSKDIAVQVVKEMAKQTTNATNVTNTKK